MKKTLSSLIVILFSIVIMKSEDVNVRAVSNELIATIQSTNMPLARQLIMEKKQINTFSKSGYTPLELTVAQGNIELCELLITNGAFVDVVDQDGGTAEIQAKYNPRIKPEVRKKILSLLEAAQHNPKNLASADYKIAEGKEDKKQTRIDLENLINSGANVNWQDKDGKTSLMGYAAEGNIESCKLLLKHGARVDIKDNKGLTAMDYACTQLKQPDGKLKAEIIALLKKSP